MDRLALIIGITAYEQDALINAARDARLVQSTLKKRGFHCKLLCNPTISQLGRVLKWLEAKSKKSDLCLIYYAGHAVEYLGSGYVLPSDFPFPVSASKLPHCAVPISELISSMTSEEGVRVFVLDACRHWPAAEQPEMHRLLVELSDIRMNERNWNNLLLSYSTSSGDTASDGEPGRSSTFCRLFCELVLDHCLTLEDCFRELGSKVMQESGRRQRPWNYSSLNISASFSDQSRFFLIQAFSAINPPKGHPLTLAPGLINGSILTCGGTGNIWSYTITGSKRIAAYDGVLTGIATGPKDTLVCVTQDGLVHVQTASNTTSFESQIHFPHGVECSKDGKTIVVFGLDEFAFFQTSEFGWTKYFHQHSPQPIHVGMFLSPKKVWLAGGNGFLVEVTFRGIKFRQRFFPKLESNIQCIARTSCGGVACAGTGGLLLLLDRKTGLVKANFQQAVRHITPRARYSALVDRRWKKESWKSAFILGQGSIPRNVKEQIESIVGYNQLLACSSPRSRRILAVGNDEGLVSLLDLRDGQVFQTINTDGGRASPIQGIHFLTDHLFAVLSEDSVVSFYASKIVA